MKKRRTAKKNKNHHSNIPEILTNCEHLIDLTTNNVKLIENPSNVGRFIERYEEHNLKKNASLSFNSLASTVFSMLKYMVSCISFSVIEMFNSILVNFYTCKYFMHDYIQESSHKRSTSTFDNPRKYKYDINDESFYGQNHDHTSSEYFFTHILTWEYRIIAKF